MRILCSRFGRRITFCFAFVIKLLAAVLAGVVNNYYGFLVGRFFQGVGSMAGYQTGLVIRKWHDDVIKWNVFRVIASLCGGFAASATPHGVSCCIVHLCLTRFEGGKPKMVYDFMPERKELTIGRADPSCRWSNEPLKQLITQLLNQPILAKCLPNC